MTCACNKVYGLVELRWGRAAATSNNFYKGGSRRNFKNGYGSVVTTPIFLKIETLSFSLNMIYYREQFERSQKLCGSEEIHYLYIVKNVGNIVLDHPVVLLSYLVGASFLSYPPEPLKSQWPWA